MRRLWPTRPMSPWVGATSLEAPVRAALPAGGLRAPGVNPFPVPSPIPSLRSLRLSGLQGLDSLCHIRQQPLLPASPGPAGPRDLPAQYKSLPRLGESAINAGIGIPIGGGLRQSERADGQRRGRRYSTSNRCTPCRVDETASLAKISVPTLVLCATRERVVSKSATARIMRGILHARRVDIDGPHLLLGSNGLGGCAAGMESIGGGAGGGGGGGGGGPRSSLQFNGGCQLTQTYSSSHFRVDNERGAPRRHRPSSPASGAHSRRRSGGAGTI